MKITVTAALLSAMMAMPGLAQDAMKNMDHSAHGMSAPMAGYMAAMDSMMDTMHDIAPANDADADFLLMMIPHHQSAIDMAVVELEHGKDEETRAMAQQIIDAQEQEIAQMKAMLERMGVAVPE